MTRAHGADRAHAAVLLELLALVEDDLAGALVRPGEEAAEHDRVGAGRDRLGDVAGELNAAVCDHRNALPGGSLRAVIDGGDLRDADTGYYARRANRPGPRPTFTASAPASISASVASGVATLPATTSTSCRPFSSRTISITPRE